MKKDTVVIGGATGYVGKALAERLKDRFDVVGITRSSKPPTDVPDITWRSADLFSLLETRKALAGAKYAVYLVHSMLPSARLTQARFEDLDLLIADNFARAAAAAKAEQIVYLGGIIPEGEKLSRHLESRREVEQALAAHGVPVTTLRASLIVGPDASSLPILLKLVRRLPVMLLPRWTKTQVQPIALDDVLTLLSQVIGKPEHYAKTYDIGGDEVLTYRDMIDRTARQLDVKRRMISVPFVSPALSKAWVAMVSGSPVELVGPLVESLEHPMVARADKKLEVPGGKAIPFDEAMRGAINDAVSRPHVAKPKRKHERNTVRSVQRLPLPGGRDAPWIADIYREWLPKFMRPFIRVDRTDDGTLSFFAVPFKKPLLVLDYSEELSSPDRSLYYITGGSLARLRQGNERNKGRLEFRIVSGGKHVLAAIHDFEPSLPWYIYSASQALVHGLVMHSFGRYLARRASVPIKVRRPAH